jgi:hypothetical protein
VTIRRRSVMGVACSLFGATITGPLSSRANAQWPGTADPSMPPTQGCVLPDLGSFQASHSSLHYAGQEYDIDAITDPQQRKAFGKALVRLSTAFGVQPTFGFYDDGGQPNAQASPDDAVIFGRSLFADQISRYQDQGLSVLAICAHEFGHIVQFHSQLERALLRGQSTVKRLELHADFLAGYYLGFRKRADSTLRLWSIGDTLNRIGDLLVTSRNHHGTPQERVAAAEAGYNVGVDNGANFQSAIQQGVQYVMEL